MEQVAFIVWRESVEALLVVGILYSWLKFVPSGRAGLPWLWSGVLAGLALSLALALVLLGIANWLEPEAQEWFQAVMALLACALVVQMVLWMNAHGSRLAQDLRASAGSSARSGQWLGLFVLVMLAVAREGSETVVFLYGVVFAAQNSHNQSVLALGLAGLGGFVAALVSFWLLQLGGRVLTWRRFFRFTQVLLLLLAGALLVSATDRLISLDAMPVWVDPIWDSSWLLTTDGGVGKVLADFAGYREYPALSQLLVWLAYWFLVIYLLRRSAGDRAASQPPKAADGAASQQAGG